MQFYRILSNISEIELLLSFKIIINDRRIIQSICLKCKCINNSFEISKEIIGNYPSSKRRDVVESIATSIDEITVRPTESPRSLPSEGTRERAKGRYRGELSPTTRTSCAIIYRPYLRPANCLFKHNKTAVPPFNLRRALFRVRAPFRFPSVLPLFLALSTLLSSTFPPLPFCPFSALSSSPSFHHTLVLLLFASIHLRLPSTFSPLLHPRGIHARDDCSRKNTATYLQV